MYNIFQIGKMQGDTFEFNKTAYKMYRPENVMSRCPENVDCDCNYPTGPQPQEQVTYSYSRYLLAHLSRRLTGELIG